MKMQEIKDKIIFKNPDKLKKYYIVREWGPIAQSDYIYEDHLNGQFIGIETGGFKKYAKRFKSESGAIKYAKKYLNWKRSDIVIEEVEAWTKSKLKKSVPANPNRLYIQTVRLSIYC